MSDHRDLNAAEKSAMFSMFDAGAAGVVLMDGPIIYYLRRRRFIQSIGPPPGIGRKSKRSAYILSATGRSWCRQNPRTPSVAPSGATS